MTIVDQFHYWLREFLSFKLVKYSCTTTVNSDTLFKTM